MTKYVISGGKPLHGEVEISGAKNAAVAILPAALLVDGVCRIENVPNISDVTMILGIMRDLGANVRMINQTTVELDCSHVYKQNVPYELARQIRASYYLIGALLGRFGRAEVPPPGGCDLGVRPIDQHLKGFSAMGAEIQVENGFIYAASPTGRLHGAQIYLDVVSVGATMNILLAAALADGLTIIENAAKEPHIVDLANFLNSMGADIMGRRDRRHQGPRGGAALGRLLLHHPRPDRGGHLYGRRGRRRRRGPASTTSFPSIWNASPPSWWRWGWRLRRMTTPSSSRRSGKLTSTNVKTMPYPGFPTDMQPQIAAVLCLAEGTSILTEGVWDNRYRYADELRRMGANIQVNGKVAVIEGVHALTGAPVCACDLRAGAAMIVAGLAANGITEIDQVYHIERGYEGIVEKLAKLGADIHEEAIPEEDWRSGNSVG